MTPVDEPALAGHATTPIARQPPPILSFAPLPSPPPPLTLLFHPDHPCATQIIDGATNKVLYMVETEVIHQPLLKKRTVTTVRRADTPEAAIAQFQWKDFFASDAVALTREIAGSTAEKGSDEGKGFGNGVEGLITMSASAWLKKSAVPFKDTVTYKDPKRKAYKWKGFAPGLSLELYSSEKPTVALVQFHKGRDSSTSKTMTTRAIEEDGRSNSESKVRSRTRHPARLTIDTSIVRSGQLDEVVVAFLYLEKVRRERDDDEFKVVPKTPPEAQKRPSSSRSQGAEQSSSSSVVRPTTST